MKITSDIKYIGVNDREIRLFEGQYATPQGMAYNSYLILDEQIAVMDSVEIGFAEQWLKNIRAEIGDREPDYLIVQHMEPDHSSSIAIFASTYPKATIVASAKAFAMMRGFFGDDYADRRLIVGEGDTLSLGKHLLTFVAAPMVHWPEVLVTYDAADKILFSADAFGKFGTTDAEQPWLDEARRYYIGIVGKYGTQVLSLLKKASALDIRSICPLHGPVLSEDLSYYINLYETWASYRPEESGVSIAYTSVYGNTRRAVLSLADKLRARGCTVRVHDLARDDMAAAVADAFRYDRCVLATTTYNGGVFPFMRDFLAHLNERGFCRRKVALVENGTWMPTAAKVMRAALEGAKELSYADTVVRILSAPNADTEAQLEALADELTVGPQ